MRKRYFLLLIMLFLAHFQATGAAAFKLEKLARLEGIPWGMAFVSQDKLLVTLREGRAVLLDLRSGKPLELSGLPAIYARGQGGLMDIRPAPDYQYSGWLYFSYSKSVNGQGTTALARAKLAHSALIDWQELFVANARSDTNRHFGSRIAFDDAGHLFLSVGDRGIRPNGQDRTTHSGSILRLNLDGSVPADNPFVGQAGVLPEIWSYGHRNPQGLVYDFRKQRLWSIEHGPRGGDELNLIIKGANYGWPVISYGKEYWGPIAVGEGTHRAGMQQPVKVYTPSIAPGSLLLYRGAAFPEWQGDLFAGSLVLRHLNQLKLDDTQVVQELRLLKEMKQRIRSLAEDRSGNLLVATDSGEIYRLIRKN